MRFYISIAIVAIAVGALVYTGVYSSAKKVVTVADLITTPGARSNIRLAARVTEEKIDYRTEPDFLLQFSVRDMAGSNVLRVNYEGIIPDTLQAGRDVIMEGDFDGQIFIAASLMTQCPSKYEPPTMPTDQAAS